MTTRDHKHRGSKHHYSLFHDSLGQSLRAWLGSLIRVQKSRYCRGWVLIGSPEEAVSPRSPGTKLPAEGALRNLPSLLQPPHLGPQSPFPGPEPPHTLSSTSGGLTPPQALEQIGLYLVMSHPGCSWRVPLGDCVHLAAVHATNPPVLHGVPHSPDDRVQPPSSPAEAEKLLLHLPRQRWEAVRAAHSPPPSPSFSIHRDINRSGDFATLRAA